MSVVSARGSKRGRNRTVSETDSHVEVKEVKTPLQIETFHLVCINKSKLFFFTKIGTVMLKVGHF